MNRRLVLQGLVVGCLTSVAPGWLRANVLVPPHSVLLRCLGTASGSARFLDGRTGNGTVGLAPEATTRFSGTCAKLATGSLHCNVSAQAMAPNGSTEELPMVQWGWPRAQKIHLPARGGR